MSRKLRIATEINSNLIIATDILPRNVLGGGNVPKYSTSWIPLRIEAGASTKHLKL